MERSDIPAINSKIANTMYSSVSDLYTAVISNGILTGAVTNSVASALTNGDATSVARFIGHKADNTTADILLYSATNGKIIISRIANGTPTRAYRVSATQIPL